MGKNLIIRRGGGISPAKFDAMVNEVAISQGLLAYSNLILSADHANDLDNGKSFGFDNDNTVQYKALKGTYSESVIVNPSAGATILVLNTTVGLNIGDEYTLQDGSNKENVIITSIDSGTVVTVPAITNAYTSAYLYDYYVGNPAGVVDYDFRADITANDTTPMDLITQSFTLTNSGGATLAHYVKFGSGNYELMTETSTDNFAFENETEEIDIKIKTTVVGDSFGKFYDFNGTTSKAVGASSTSFLPHTMYYDIKQTSVNALDVVISFNNGDYRLQLTNASSIDYVTLGNTSQIPLGEPNITGKLIIRNIGVNDIKAFYKGVEVTVGSNLADLTAITKVALGFREVSNDRFATMEMEKIILSSHVITDQQALDMTSGAVDVDSILTPANSEVIYDANADSDATVIENLGSDAGYDLTTTAVTLETGSPLLNIQLELGGVSNV